MDNAREVLFEMENVTRDYQGRRVLDIRHMDIYKSEILALVGPSGAGKSTLLRLLNFLETPTSGTIKFHDQVFTSSQAMPLGYRRKVTTVFQQPLLLSRSVQSNIRLGLVLRGLQSEYQLVQSTLEEVGLASLAQQAAKTLSGGEAQRVSLARAMVIQPEVLLLDEPTANLDPYNVVQIENIIRGINQKRGVTVVLVTHNIFQAKRLADRVVFLLDGKPVEVNSTDQFFENPSDPRTGLFTRGEMVY